MSKSSSSSDDDRRERKRRRRRERKQQRRENNDDDEECSRRPAKRQKKDHDTKPRKAQTTKKHSMKYESSSANDKDNDNDSSRSGDYSGDSSDSRRKRKHKSKKKKKEKKKRKSHNKEDLKKRSPSPPSFGKYGIIKPTDMAAKQRSFEIWMAEVKAIPSFTGSKWELQEYFKEYAEDYNTGTLPHKKYYDYDKWEIQEYENQKNQEQSKMASANSMLADEARHQAALRQTQEEKRKQDMQFLRATIVNSTKLEDMKRQRDLQAELQHAFKMGDKERIARIKQKLDIVER
jgi:hypothetical protein